MTKEEIRKLIQDMIREYTGTGDMASTGLTSDDGNNIPSQRPFYDDIDELEFYTDQGAPYGGAEGMEKRGTINPNIQKHVKF
jgi:hypothetical protein